MLRTSQYKYVLYDRGNNREQLFDLSKDRGEMRNLVVEKAYQTVLEHLRGLMDHWLRENDIRPTRRNLNDVPGGEHR